VIVTQDAKKDQLHERLQLKSCESAFSQLIVSGTNCSIYESQIIVEKAKEVFGLGEYSQKRYLNDGQMVFVAVSAKAPAGVGIGECEKVKVVLTHLNRVEDLEVLQKHGASGKRRQQVVRMTVEAKEQGALLTQEDLALILDCDVRTIRKDIEKLSSQGVIVATRGTIRDIGPGVTHKRKTVELWLGGKEELHIARQLNHSLRAVERYIQTYCRVVYVQQELRNMLKTALVVGISVSLAKSYFEMHQELMGSNAFYRERLEEVLKVGHEHWEACDEKKSRLPTGESSQGDKR